MNILHISNSDSGGAANAMMTLHNSLTDNNVKSKVLVLHSSKKNNPAIYSFLDQRSILKKAKHSFEYRIFNLRRKLLRYKYGIGSDFTFFDGPYDIIDHQLFKWADIIHLHWYHNFISLPKLLEKCTKPTIFTLHDENLFLGGYHYTFDKIRANRDAQKLDDIHLEKKKEIIQDKRNLHFVAPSKWLYDKLASNSFSNAYHIPYGIDSSNFILKDKAQVRQKLGLSENSNVYLLVADYLKSARKGIMETIQAFIKINPKNSILVVLGRIKHPVLYDNVKYLGFVEDKRELSEAYSMADVYVNPTLADNLPNTVLESHACGTPVIGFDTGGMKDMINKFNGRLLTPNDFEGIFDAKLLQKLKNLDQIKIIDMCKKIYNIEKQRDHYHNIYNERIME